MAEKRRRVWLRKLVILAVGAGIIWCMLRWFEHRQVYFPYGTLSADGTELGRPVEDVYFRTEDGVELNAWFYPARAGSARKHLVFLVCHGNGGNISHRLDLCELLLETGAAVMLFDYRGYGRSDGRPSEEGTYKDAQAAHAWLREKGFAGTNIIAYGESLGGAVAAELALREPVAGVILQSTFTSVPDIGSELFPWLPVRRLSRIRYDTVAKLPRLKIPLLVMHSRSDSMIRYRHGEALFEAANEPKLFQEIAGNHNDQPLVEPERFRKGLEKFLTMIEQSGAERAAERQ